MNDITGIVKCRPGPSGHESFAPHKFVSVGTVSAKECTRENPGTEDKRDCE